MSVLLTVIFWLIFTFWVGIWLFYLTLAFLINSIYQLARFWHWLTKLL